MKNHSKTFTHVSKRKMIERGLSVVAGVDLGDKHSHVCLINLDGEIVERKKLRTSPAAFERYFGGWASMRVVLEAGKTKVPRAALSSYRRPRQPDQPSTRLAPASRLGITRPDRDEMRRLVIGRVS